MKSKDKCGSGWTVHKLITIILLILILAIVVAGVITGGLNPMIERLGEKYDNVLAKFGIGENKTIVDENCFPWEKAEGLSLNIERRICRGYCELKDDKTNYSYYIESGEFKKNEYDLNPLMNFDEKIKNLWNLAESNKGISVYPQSTIIDRKEEIVEGEILPSGRWSLATKESYDLRIEFSSIERKSLYDDAEFIWDNDKEEWFVNVKGFGSSNLISLLVVQKRRFTNQEIKDRAKELEGQGKDVEIKDNEIKLETKYYE